MAVAIEFVSHISLLPITMALSLEDMMDSLLSLEESTTIPVQTSSGDVFPVRIRMSDPVALFAQQFAQQFQFNPRIIGRFRFYCALEWDEDTPLSGWMSVHRSKGTWLDVYKTEFKLPHRLFLVIADDSDAEKTEKVKLIRSLIHCYGGSEDMDDSTLYAEYSYWLLRTPTQEMNRYQMVSAFVRQSSHLFDAMCCV